MLDGSVPVLEASLSLQSPWDPKKFQDMTVGIPLAILDRPEGKHDIILQFSGVQWTIYIDGRLYDNDFALGYPLASRMKLWSLNPDYVSEANLYEPAIQPEQIACVATAIKQIKHMITSIMEECNHISHPSIMVRRCPILDI